MGFLYMAAFVESTRALAEMTQSVSIPVAESYLRPPKLGNRFPIAFAVANASGDFSVKLGGGDYATVDASGITTSNQFVLALGVEPAILTTAASARTAIIRWFYDHPINPAKYQIRTFNISQDTTEAEVTIPPRAIELALTSISANGTYRIDDRSYDGGVITLEYNQLSDEYPYNIPVFKGSRLRFDSSSGTITIQGYWVIAA